MLVIFYYTICSIIIAFALIIGISELFYRIKYRGADWLIAKAKKTPYSDIGDYMERYWLVPQVPKTGGRDKEGRGFVKFYQRPIAFVMQLLGIALRVHNIKRSDKGRDYHNHPWPFITIILKGGYWEHRPIYSKDGYFLYVDIKWHNAGSILFRRSGHLHRLEIKPAYASNPNQTWTLFITFREVREWGFITKVDYMTRADKYQK